MAELKFDHSKDLDFAETLGFSKEDVKEVNMKFAKISHFIVTKNPLKESELIEEVAKTFSYNELLFATTIFITEKTAEIVKGNPMIAMLAALKENLKK